MQMVYVPKGQLISKCPFGVLKKIPQTGYSAPGLFRVKPVRFDIQCTAQPMRLKVYSVFFTVTGLLEIVQGSNLA